MSTTIWNSDLLSNGSIFRITSFTTASETASSNPPRIASHSLRRAGFAMLAIQEGRQAIAKEAMDPGIALHLAAPHDAAPAKRSASQGVMTNATASEINMPMLALIGIGLM